MRTESDLKDAVFELAGDPVGTEYMLQRIGPLIAPHHHLGFRRLTRLAPLGAAVVVVAVVAVALAVWQHGTAQRPSQLAGGAGVTVPVPSPSTSRPFSALPPTESALVAKARAILGPAASIVVEAGSDNTGTAVTSPPTPTSASASATAARQDNSAQRPAIVGVLTIAGRAGTFDLELGPSAPGTGASCEQWIPCTVRTVPGGGSIAYGTVRNSDVAAGAAGASTSDVRYVSADGAVITMHLHSGAGGGNVLSLQQMVDFVTDARWFT